MRYQALVEQRKACLRCVNLGLTNPARERGLDSDHIGPWTRWHGELNAKLMVVGRDWGTVALFRRQQGLDKHTPNSTNAKLAELLERQGVEIGQAGKPGPASIFLTNSILCLKLDTGDHISAWYENCRPFLRKQIELVRPRVVVALGQIPYESTLRAFGLKTRKAFKVAVKDPEGIELLSGVSLFAVYHPSPQYRRQRSAEPEIDWKRLPPLA